MYNEVGKKCGRITKGYLLISTQKQLLSSSGNISGIFSITNMALW